MTRKSHRRISQERFVKFKSSPACNSVRSCCHSSLVMLLIYFLPVFLSVKIRTEAERAQHKRHSTLVLVDNMRIFFFFSPCCCFSPHSLPFHVLHFSLAGHKCLIRCLAVHINEEGTAGCFLKRAAACLSTASER